MESFNSNKDTSGFHCEFCGRKFSLRIKVVQHKRKNHNELVDIKDRRAETGSNSSGYISDGYTDGLLSVSMPAELTARPPSGEIAEPQFDANINTTSSASTAAVDYAGVCGTSESAMERPSVICQSDPVPRLRKTEHTTEAARDFVTSRKRFTCCLCPVTFHLLPEWFVHYEQCHHADSTRPEPDSAENPADCPVNVTVEAEPAASEDGPWQPLPDLGHLTRMRCFLGALREKVLANNLERWKTDVVYENDEELFQPNMSSSETAHCEHQTADDTACSMCFKARASNTFLEKHQKEHGDASSLKCPACPRKFRFLSSMRKHIQKQHPLSSAKPGAETVLKKKARVTFSKRAASGEANDLLDVNLFKDTLSPSECSQNVLKNENISLAAEGIIHFDNRCFQCSEIFKGSEALTSHMKLAHGAHEAMNLEFISKTDKPDARVRSDCVTEKDKLHNRSSQSIIHGVSVQKENDVCFKCVSNESENPCLIRADRGNNELSNNSTCQPVLRSQFSYLHHYEQECTIERSYHLDPAQNMNMDLIPWQSGNENFEKNSDAGVEAAWEAVRAEAIRRRRFSRRTVSTASRGVYPKRCRHCPKWLFSSEAVKAHSKVHSNSETSIGCPECSQTFNSKSLVEYHIKHEHGDLSSSQDGGQGRESERPRAAALQVEGNKAGFLRKRQRGLRSCLSDKVRCSYCPKYLHASSIIAHEKIHTGGKPFNCPSCFRNFGRHDHLKKHMEKIHPLPIASKAATAKGSQKPKRTSCKRKSEKEDCNNNGELKLFCQECGKAAASNQALVNHRRVHVSEKNLHTCPHCAKVFRYFKNFRCHMLLMHDELPPLETVTSCAKKQSKSISPARTGKACSIKKSHPGAMKKARASVIQLKKERRISAPAGKKKEYSEGTEARMKRSLKRKSSDGEVMDEDWENEWETPYICLLCDSPFRRFESLKVHLKNWHQLIEEQADGLAKVIQSQHDLVQESEKARKDGKLPDEGMRCGDV